MTELDAAIARAYGVAIETEPLLPPPDAEAEAFLRSAIEIACVIGDRRSAPPEAAPWEPLPQRAVAAPPAQERDRAVARALAWAAEQGARLNGIAVRVDPTGGAAIHATRALSAGEQILVVPRHLMLIRADRDELAVWLAVEAADPDSPWRAYLDALPQRFDEMPVFHGAAEHAALAGTAAYALAEQTNHDVRACHARLPDDVRARVSLADFAWGRAILASRGFHAPGTFEHQIALMPVVEFFNHRLGDTTWSFDPAIGDYVITTERAFAAGEEVGFAYGDRSNTRLLVHYGFTDPGAPGEAAVVFERAADPAADLAGHLLWGLPLGAPAVVCVGARLDERMFRALSVARLHASSAADREHAAETGLTARGDVPWLGPAVEAATLALLGDAARRALAELDAGAPHGSADLPWDRSCALVRASERAVLLEVLDLAGGGSSQLAEAYRRALAAHITR